MYTTKSTIKWNKKYIQRITIVLTSTWKESMKNNKTIGQIYGNREAMGFLYSGLKYYLVGPKVFDSIKDLTPMEFCKNDAGIRVGRVGRKNFNRIATKLCADGHACRRNVSRDRRDISK